VSVAHNGEITRLRLVKSRIYSREPITNAVEGRKALRLIDEAMKAWAILRAIVDGDRRLPVTAIDMLQDLRARIESAILGVVACHST
jgi:hypothetical protein